MTKKEFMEELEILLSSLPKEEREDVLRYYDSYFEDAGEEQEYIVIKELGSAGRVAAQILREFRQEKSEGIYTERGYQEQEDKKETPIRYETKKEKEKQEKTSFYDGTKMEEKVHQPKKKLSKSSGILLFILTILTFPIWISVLGAVFGTLFGILVAICGTVVGFGVVGTVCMVAGVVVLFVGIVKCLALPIVGLVFMALALLVFGLGCLLVVATMACIKLIIWIIKTVWNILKQVLNGRKEAMV